MLTPVHHNWVPMSLTRAQRERRFFVEMGISRSNSKEWRIVNLTHGRLVERTGDAATRWCWTWLTRSENRFDSERYRSLIRALIDCAQAYFGGEGGASSDDELCMIVNDNPYTVPSVDMHDLHLQALVRFASRTLTLTNSGQELFSVTFDAQNYIALGSLTDVAPGDVIARTSEHSSDTLAAATRAEDIRAEEERSVARDIAPLLPSKSAVLQDDGSAQLRSSTCTTSVPASSSSVSNLATTSEHSTDTLPASTRLEEVLQARADVRAEVGRSLQHLLKQCTLPCQWDWFCVSDYVTLPSESSEILEQGFADYLDRSMPDDIRQAYLQTLCTKLSGLLFGGAKCSVDFDEMQLCWHDMLFDRPRATLLRRTHSVVMKSDADFWLSSSCVQRVHAYVPTAESEALTCTICCATLELGDHATQLDICHDAFHVSCFEKLIASHRRCPNCREFFAAPRGTLLSAKASMSIERISKHLDSLAGYEEHGILEICYRCESSAEPGSSYVGVEHVAYLPASLQGEALCRRLQCAFAAGLVFIAGLSPNGGRKLLWNSIHHMVDRTESDHDVTYLARLDQELSEAGIP